MRAASVSQGRDFNIKRSSSVSGCSRRTLLLPTDLYSSGTYSLPPGGSCGNLTGVLELEFDCVVDVTTTSGRSEMDDDDDEDPLVFVVGLRRRRCWPVRTFIWMKGRCCSATCL
jgi:hypothetical protein